MKKIQQAAHKKETKKKVFFLFASIEQFSGFLFFIVVIILSSWVIIVVENRVNEPGQVGLSQLTLTGDNLFTIEEDVRKAIMELDSLNTYVAQNVDDIQQEIMRLPWIKQVSVRKQWPDRLIIHIVEHQPNYYWNELFLLDNDGTVFSVPREWMGNDKIPKLFGPIGKEKQILTIYRELEKVSNKFSNKNLTLSIRFASADERNAWQLLVRPCIDGVCTHNQDIKLMLGREKMVERYGRFIRFFSDIQAGLATNERLIEVDLRYENGISVSKQKIES